MNALRPVLLVLLLAACPPNEKPNVVSAPVVPAPLEVKPAPAAPPVVEVVDASVPAPQPIPAAAVEEKLVETEVFGKATLVGIKSVKTVLVLNKAPCVPVPEQLDVWGVENVAKPAKLFGEVFVVDGQQAWLCVYALDGAGAVVGAAQDAASPRTITGPEEVVFKGVTFALKAVKPAVTPKGLAP